MRLRAEYRVGPELKFLANLDMMRLMERTLRRAAVPYTLSKGFNPHIKLSMGTVLPVGLWGQKEYFDLELRYDMVPEEFMTKVNECLPVYMRIKKCIKIPDSAPSLMKVINAASYSFVVGEPCIDLQQWRERILAADSLTVKSKGKKRNVDKDLRPGIYKVDVYKWQNFGIIDIWTDAGEAVNIRYDELAAMLAVTGIEEASIDDIFRSGNYIKEGARFYSPMEKVR